MSFYLSLLYLVVEYVRPQELYPAFSDYPLAKMVLAALAAAFLLEGKKFRNRNILRGLVLGYLFWFTVSCLAAYNTKVAFDLWVDFFKWVVIFLLLTNCINDRRKLYLFVTVLVLVNFKLAQFVVRVWVANGFYSDPRGIYEGYGVGGGFFRNPNDMGAAFNSIAGISFLLATHDDTAMWGRIKMKWLHLLCAASFGVAIIATSSRGGILALFVVLVLMLLKTRRRVFYLVLLTFIVTLGISLIPSDNWERFKKMGSEEDATAQSRLRLWAAGMRMANERPLTGVGPANFALYNQEVYRSPSRTVQHNIFVQAASELGYPGLVLLGLMIAATLRNQRATRRILLARKEPDRFLLGLSHGLDICTIGFVVNGFFITVLYYPFFWMIMTLSASLRDAAERGTKKELKRQPSSLACADLCSESST